MFRSMLVATIACSVALPAAAGDKPKAKPKPALAASANALLLRGDDVNRTGTAPPGRARRATFILPPAPGGVEQALAAPRRLVLHRELQAGDSGTVRVGTASTWDQDLRNVEVTGEAGGSYAVRDYFAAQPKPRQRRSPLGAMFVLKLDGQEESPSFSVGGGGVPAALWGVVPRN